jgi:hypothetical protein
MMSWKYKAGLFLIGTVVVIWVTSAEVTQVSCRSWILILYIKLQISLLDNLLSIVVDLCSLLGGQQIVICRGI